MAYKAPIWEDGKSPAISAENLNNLSRAAEGAQVLYGSSAPTSSTEGAVGQFYLVVVADSDGNYPLYQCVSIANGSYVWRDTRRIPDSITSMLGIPAPGTVNSALNVLAHVGNLHVWERVQTYSEPVPEVPAGYTLGDVETNVVISSGGTTTIGWITDPSNITVKNDGTVVFPSNSSGSTKSVSDWAKYSYYSDMQGKYCHVSQEAGTHVDGITFFFPSNASLSNVSGTGLVASKLQRVIGYPYTPAIPAGTTTDYLTSTDRNAYTEGTVDNTTITYLGQLGGGARIEVGSYVGTGTYGSSNPNSLTFGFEPKIFFLVSESWATNESINMPLYSSLGHGYLYRNSNYENRTANLSWNGKTISWYAGASATYQCNDSGKHYYYTAIG